MTIRLVAWLAFVGAFIAVAYAGRASAGKPDEDVLYRYDTAVGILVQSVIVLAIVLWITRGPMQRDLLGLRAPPVVERGDRVVDRPCRRDSRRHPDPREPASRRRGAGLSPPTGGIPPRAAVPRERRPDRRRHSSGRGADVRGAGYSLLARFGRVVAILVVGVTFGLVHGLVYGLAALTVFGIGLAWLRAKPTSVPCIVIHCLFNAVALVAAVTI